MSLSLDPSDLRCLAVFFDCRDAACALDAAAERVSRLEEPLLVDMLLIEEEMKDEERRRKRKKGEEG